MQSKEPQELSDQSFEEVQQSNINIPESVQQFFDSEESKSHSEYTPQGAAMEGGEEIDMLQIHVDKWVEYYNKN